MSSDQEAKTTAHALRCLLAEDEPLICMELQATLEEAGVEVVGPFASCADILAWLADDTPDIALLDLNLRDGPCHDVVSTLVRRRVPVVICSGDRRDAFTPGDLASLIWLDKPTDPVVIRDLIVQLSAPRRMTG